VLVMGCVEIAFLCAGDTRRRAGLEHRPHQLETRRCLPRDDAAGGIAGVCAVGAEPDDADHLLHVALARARVGAGGTARTAVETLFDAAEKNATIDGSRPWVQLDDLLEPHVLLAFVSETAPFLTPTTASAACRTAGSGGDRQRCACSVRRVTRFVVDCETLLRIAAGEVDVAAEHTLLAPTLVRSQALSALYEAARRGEISSAQGLERVTRINSLKVRFLGDKVLQRTAWRVADQLGWENTYEAEFVALTQLQADSFVTSDGDLAQAVSGLVEAATIDALRKA
jgi:predicted nucleic acid-binding protein